MNTVTKITPHLNSIQAPKFLSNMPIWLIWNLEPGKNEFDKPRKVPYYANGSKRNGIQGRAEDRAQLVTLETARQAAAKRGFSGIGHVCLDGDFTVIDFDRCVVDGVLNPVIDEMTTGTYAEYSPSGTGIHLYVKGNLRGHNDKSMATADLFGIELFSTKGYVTFTGAATEMTTLLGNTDTIGEASNDLQKLVSLRFGNVSSTLISEQEPRGVSISVINQILEKLDPDMGYADWLKVGMGLHHEARGEGFDLWDQWSSTGSKYESHDALKGKWETFGRNNGKVITINSLIQMANANGAQISINAVSMEEFEDLDAVNDASFRTSDEAHHHAGELQRFNIQSLDQFAVQTNQEYLIKGIIPKATLGVLFGESGSGKSFVTLDMCIAIARGQPWRGKRTMQGSIVYVVAEGAAGFRNRILAYTRHHNIDPATIPLKILNDTPNLLLANETKALIEAIKSLSELPSLVVIDTLAQTMAGGNENASEDMGKALAQCKLIHKYTGAMVLLVHHSGKDSSKGARGWSGMRAAADVELEVTRSVQGRALRTTKQKDGADYQAWGFGLEVVTIGVDQDGDSVTSCVIVETELPKKDKPMSSYGPVEQAILKVMGELCMVQNSGIERKEVINLVMQNFPEIVDSEEIKVKKATIRRSLKAFCNGENAIYTLEDDDTLTIFDVK